MSLIVVFHNDGTGLEHDSNYDVTAYVNQSKIWSGRVEGHHRKDGWAELVTMLTDQFKDYGYNE